MKVQIDFSKTVGKMKPVHGVNNGPVTFNFMRDATALFVRAGIPYSRLHDTEGDYGCGEYVDIPAVFKVFEADPENPANYNFKMTDEYIKAIRKAGAKVIYRLGVTIENGPIKRHIYPPKDFHQWARICEGVIRHYTEGWADGMQDGVEYFEIWNEPEFYNHMWLGTHEEFYKLFKDTIIYLKKKFPNVKIGGPATGNNDKPFTEGFFKYITEGERAPLDFFSFHTYFRNPKKHVHDRFNEVRALLDKSGYKDVPIFITEWNHVNGWDHMEEEYKRVSDHTGAAFVACALCELQKTGYAIANYYDAQFGAGSSFNGLFKLARFEGHDDVQPLAPKPSFYAMEMFGDLYRLGTEAYSDAEEDVSVVAATDGTTDSFLIGRYNQTAQNNVTAVIDVKNAHGTKADIIRYRADVNDVEIETVDVIPNTITLAPYSFARIVIHN